MAYYVSRCPRLRKQPERGGRLRFQSCYPRRRSGGGVSCGFFRDEEGDDFVGCKGYNTVVSYDGYCIFRDDGDDFVICDDFEILRREDDDGDDFVIYDDFVILREDDFAGCNGYNTVVFYDGYGIFHDDGNDFVVCDDYDTVVSYDGYGILRDDGDDFAVCDGYGIVVFYKGYGIYYQFCGFYYLFFGFLSDEVRGDSDGYVFLQGNGHPNGFCPDEVRGDSDGYVFSQDNDHPNILGFFRDEVRGVYDGEVFLQDNGHPNIFGEEELTRHSDYSVCGDSGSYSFLHNNGYFFDIREGEELPQRSDYENLDLPVDACGDSVGYCFLHDSGYPDILEGEELPQHSDYETMDVSGDTCHCRISRMTPKPTKCRICDYQISKFFHQVQLSKQLGVYDVSALDRRFRTGAMICDVSVLVCDYPTHPSVVEKVLELFRPLGIYAASAIGGRFKTCAMASCAVSVLGDDPTHLSLRIYAVSAIGGRFKTCAIAICDILVLSDYSTHPSVERFKEINVKTFEMSCDTLVFCICPIRQCVFKVDNIDFVISCDTRDYDRSLSSFSRTGDRGTWDFLWCAYHNYQICKLLDFLSSKPSCYGTRHFLDAFRNYPVSKLFEFSHDSQICLWGVDADDVSELFWNRLSTFVKTRCEVLDWSHYPSSERSNTHEADLSAGDSCSGQEHFYCGFCYGGFDSFWNSCGCQIEKLLVVLQYLMLYNMQFLYDHETRQHLVTYYEKVSCGVLLQSSHERCFYFEVSGCRDLMICRWLESYDYKAKETSYDNFCDFQIVSSGDFQIFHECSNFFFEVLDFCEFTTIGRGGLEVYKAGEMSYLFSRDFQIHQRLRTYGVKIAVCYSQRFQEFSLCMSDSCDSQTRQRRVIFNTHDGICGRLEMFKADFEVLDRCYSWVLEQVCKHFFSETYQDYAIFSALASWSVAASCMVVSSFLGQLCISRLTTTDMLRLLLAKLQITAPFDTRVCEMNDDTPVASLCASFPWHEPRLFLPSIFFVQFHWGAATLKNQSTSILATITGCVDLLENAATLLSSLSETIWFVSKRIPHLARVTNKFALRCWVMTLGGFSSTLKASE